MSIAIVVGAASGIGWASARALAADGYRVVVADRNLDGAQARAAELGAPHTASFVDVSDEASVATLFEHTGPVDAVVSCAGFSNVGLIVDMPVDDFRSVIDVCLTGAFIVAKYAGRHLTDGGSLVSISSLNGRQPAAGMSAYCSAKAGLSMLTQVAALELAGRGIRVNAVAPGFVEVDSPVNPVTDEYAAAVSVNPTGRPGRPDEIAAAVVWLAGAEAGFVTGAVLRVDGGASAGTSALPVHFPSSTALQRAEA